MWQNLAAKNVSKILPEHENRPAADVCKND